MMKLEHPQEIEVWYVIPAVKRELAMSMIKDYGFSQKKVADTLGVTESAVSQYINSKRAMEIQFSQDFKDLVRQSAGLVMQSKANMVREIQYLCSAFRKSKMICDLHRKHGVVYLNECKACEGFYE